MPGSGFADSMPAGGPAANRSREWMPRVDAASGHCGSTGSLPAVERSPVGLCMAGPGRAPALSLLPALPALPILPVLPVFPILPLLPILPVLPPFPLLPTPSRSFRSSRSFRFSRPSHSFPLLPAPSGSPALPTPSRSSRLSRSFRSFRSSRPFRSSPLFRRPDVLMKYRRVRDSVKKSYLCIR